MSDPTPTLLTEALRLLRIGGPDEVTAWYRRLTPDQRAAALAQWDQFEAARNAARAAADALTEAPASPAELTRVLASLGPLEFEFLSGFLAEHEHRWERDRSGRRRSGPLAVRGYPSRWLSRARHVGHGLRSPAD